MPTIRTIAFRISVVCVLGLVAGCSRSPQEKEAKFLKRGEALLAKKDYARAALEFKNAAAAMPKDAEPMYQIGLVYLETGRLGSAVGAFQQALRLNPKHVGAQVKFAGLLTTSQRPDILADAEKRLQRVLEADPNNLEALHTLADAETKLGKPQDAEKLLDDVVERFPADLRSAVLLARARMSENNPSRAEELLKKAVEHAPQSSDAALALGRLYIQLHKDGQAEAEIRRALALNSKSAPALLSLALIQTNGNRLSEAEETFKRLSSVPDKDYQPIYGSFLMQKGRQDEALAEFQRLARAAPDDRQARARVVAVYVIMNRIPQAEALLADALKHNPKDADALIERAELRLRARDTTGAEQDLQQVLKFQPNSPEAHYEFAELKHMQGSTLDARQELTKALDLNRNYLPARVALAWNFINTEQPKAALDLLDQTPASQKNNISVLIERNWALLVAGNLKEAREGIDKGLKSGRAPDLVEQDGFLKMKEGNFAGARADAEELLGRYPEQDPDNIRAVRLLVDSCTAQNQKPKAVEVLRAAVAQRPKSAQLQKLLGLLLEEFGDPAGARKAFEAALAADPGFLPAKLELAHIDLAENRLDSARQALSSILASNPRNVHAWLMLGDAEASAGNRPAAIAKYRAVLAIDQSNVLALKNLANIMIQDDPGQGLAFAQQAVELAPKDPAAQDVLGWASYRKGMYGFAAEHLKMAVELEPTPSRQYHLALCYMKSGQDSLGRPLLAAALQKDPNLPQKDRGW